MGLVGRGIGCGPGGGGGGGVGGWSVCVYVLWHSLVGGLEGGTCCVSVCFMLCLLPVWCACSGCLEHDCGDSLMSDI